MGTDTTFPVEVFATGQWGGHTWTVADLDQMAANFARLLPLGIKPPVKLGHDDKQILAGQVDGAPALGWVAGLRRVGTKLLADIANIPAVLHELVKAGRYARVSSEIYPQFEQTSAEANLHSGVTGHVLSAVAFLGADVPEVKTLEDLGAYLHVEGLAFSEADPQCMAFAGGWDESQHPRDDNGKFAPGDGVSFKRAGDGKVTRGTVVGKLGKLVGLAPGDVHNPNDFPDRIVVDTHLGRVLVHPSKLRKHGESLADPADGFAAAPGSLFGFQRAVAEAVGRAFGLDTAILELFDDAVIVQQGDRLMSVPVTEDANGDVLLGQAVEVAVAYQPIAATERPHPRTTPTVEDASMTEADKQAVAEAQAKQDEKIATLTAQVQATETARATDAAELARLKAENDRLAKSTAIAESVARHTAAERFADVRMTATNLRITQAQRPALIALHARLAEAGTVIALAEAASLKLFSDKETARDLTLVDLLERAVDAGLPLTVKLKQVSIPGDDPTGIATAETAEDVIRCIAKRDALDLTQADDMRKATKLAMAERPDLRRNYGSAA